MEPRELCCYLYCLIPSGRGIEATTVGVDERFPIQVLECGEMSAVYSEVVLEDFVGAAAEARLQDLTWLGPRVGRHMAVIEQVMRWTPVMPAQFATLYTSVESLESFVAAHREAIAGFFAQLGDKQEWAVKGLVDRTRALEELWQLTARDLVPEATPGTRYFQEKRLKAQLERELKQRLRLFCQQAATALGKHAGGFKERKIPPSASESTEGEVVFNWAFLILPVALDEFKASLKQLNAEEALPGLQLALTGPWPPFSFASDLSAGGPE